jgi:hypothetical protein
VSELDGYDYVDGVLKDAGEVWRARLGTPPAVDVSWFAKEAPTRRWWWAAAAGAAAVAICALAIAFLPSISPPAATLPPGSSPITGTTPSPPTTATATATPSPLPLLTAPPTSSPAPAFPYEIVREGDLVSVTGNIIDWPAGPRVCAWMVWDLSNPPQPGCFDGRDLPITGVDPRDLSGAEWYSARDPGPGKVWVTGYLRVFGTWRDGTIEVVEVLPAEKPESPFSLPPVPCDPPTGGWPGDPDDFDPYDPEIFARTLQYELQQHPDLYGGLWSAVDENSLGGVARHALVVGTVGDVSSVEAELREIYPANLCVVQVEHNTLELEAVVDRLRAADRDWVVDVDPKINQVAVWLPVVEQGAADVLAEDSGKVHVVPVAERVDADLPPNGERICGRLKQAECDVVIALVREARPDAFTEDSVEVVDYECPPGARCPAIWFYTVVVAPSGCPGIPIAFSVRHLSHFDSVSEREQVLPPHVADLLPAECLVGTPPNAERICGRLDRAHCALAISFVRDAKPGAYAADSVEVAEYQCAPGQRCSVRTSYIVAVVHPGCAGGPIAFSVRPQFEVDRVVEYPYSLPPHVADLLPPSCAIDPPP